MRNSKRWITTLVVATGALTTGVAATGFSIAIPFVTMPGAMAQAPSAARSRAIVLVRDAATAFGRGDLSRTLALTDRAITTDPSYPRAYVYRGVALQKQGNKEGARAAFDKVLKLAPRGADADYARDKLRELGPVRPAPTPPRTGKVRVQSSSSADPMYPSQNIVRKLVHLSGVLSLTFVPRSSLVVSGAHDGSVNLWDARSGQSRWKTQGHSDRVNTVAVSPDGSLLASGSRDEFVRLRRLSDGMSVRVLQPKSGAITSLAFSPDGKNLAAATMSGIVVWNANSGQILRRGQTGIGATAIAYAPDGNTMASAGIDRIVRLWNPRTGQLTRSLPRSQVVISALAFSPENQILAVGGLGQCTLWDVRIARAVTVLYTGSVISEIAYAPDGKTIATSSYDKFVRLWNADSGQLLWKLRGHVADASSVSWSSDGALLASGSADKNITVWRIQ